MGETLGYRKFGNELLRYGDLDPVYIMLVETDVPSDVRIRFCFAYWLFYHVGVAARIASRPSRKFFDEVQRQFDDGCPRGTERRHFRGEKAQVAIDKLRRMTNGKVEPLVGHLFAPRKVMTPVTFADVRDRVLQLPQFGPWMAFKVADMGERVLHYSVNFDACELEMYRDPVKGAALIEHGNQEALIGPVDVRKVVKRLTKQFSRHSAPPDNVRPVNIQEIETILCKYKSHVNGHYPLGKDTLEIYEALRGWGSLAKKFRQTVKRGRAYKRYANAS